MVDFRQVDASLTANDAVLEEVFFFFFFFPVLVVWRWLYPSLLLRVTYASSLDVRCRKLLSGKKMEFPIRFSIKGRL